MPEPAKMGVCTEDEINIKLKWILDKVWFSINVRLVTLVDDQKTKNQNPKQPKYFFDSIQIKEPSWSHFELQQEQKQQQKDLFIWLLVTEWCNEEGKTHKLKKEETIKASTIFNWKYLGYFG